MIAPKVILLVLWGIELGLGIANHGKPKAGKHSVWESVVGLAIVASLLWWGGFWG